MQGREAVRLRGVRKRFGAHTAVEGLDLVVPAGSIYGLLGPNGSGKTTTLRMIMGILVPDAGEVELLGGRPDAARQRRVGYLPEERGLYRRMRVSDVLVFLAEIRGVPRAEGTRRARGWLERLGLGEWGDRRVEDLSKGMQQKVQFIGTVLHEPELLVLDEPFSGLDPINQDVLEAIVRDLHARGTTILFSTHLMDQAERLCERVCLISRARKVLDGDLGEIKRRERKGVVAVEFEGDSAWLEAPEVMAREVVGRGVHLVLRAGGDPAALLARALGAGARIRRWELLEPRLHEIFVRLAGPAGTDAALPGPVSAAGLP
jgi:ABC-2 type transport system ATP-binding protein